MRMGDLPNRDSHFVRLIGTGRVEQTGLWALPTLSCLIERANWFTARCRKNSKKLPGDFSRGNREDDAPARAGILASFRA
jgi:hypothetical protein